MSISLVSCLSQHLLISAGEGQELHFAWHPQSSSTLAVTVRDGVLMVDVDTLKAGAGTDVTCKQDELQNGLRLLHTSSHAPTSSVAFSPDGALVAAAVSDGKVMQTESFQRATTHQILSDAMPTNGSSHQCNSPNQQRLYAGEHLGY